MSTTTQQRDTTMDLITNAVICAYMEDLDGMEQAVKFLRVINGRLHRFPRRCTHAMKGGRM